jgi:APA family basic amino acid/polyamine antiporter
MAAGEVKDPGRNIPRALFGGMVIVIAIYCSANLAYFYALPVAEVASSNSTLHRDALPVASKAAMTFLGEYGGKLVAIAFVVSALGALNGSILSNARVPFAMARDGYMAARLAALHPRTLVPVRVIVVQAVWSSLLAVSGSYDQLTDCLIFASWIFYGLTASAVFVLRRRRPDAPRPYRTLGYPLVPALFVVVAGWLVVNTALERPVESVTGIVLILVGLPVYVGFRARAARRA